MPNKNKKEKVSRVPRRWTGRAGRARDRAEGGGELPGSGARLGSGVLRERGRSLPPPGVGAGGGGSRRGRGAQAGTGVLMALVAAKVGGGVGARPGAARAVGVRGQVGPRRWLTQPRRRLGRGSRGEGAGAYQGPPAGEMGSERTPFKA